MKDFTIDLDIAETGAQAFGWLYVLVLFWAMITPLDLVDVAILSYIALLTSYYFYQARSLNIDNLRLSMLWFFDILPTYLIYYIQ